MIECTNCGGQIIDINGKQKCSQCHRVFNNNGLMEDFTFSGYIIADPDNVPLIEGGYLKLQPMTIKQCKIVAHMLKNYNHQEVRATISFNDSWTMAMNRLFHALIRDIEIGIGLDMFILTFDDGTEIKWIPNGFAEIKEWAKIYFGNAKYKKTGYGTWIESWTNFSKKRALKTIDGLLKWIDLKGFEIDRYQSERETLNNKGNI